MKAFDKLQSYGHFAMHFFLYCGAASWLAFYNIYLLEMGYKGPQIGWINGLMQSTAFFMIPLWGIWADRYGTKKLLVTAIFIDAVLIYFLGFIHGFTVLVLFTLVLTFFNHPLGPLADTLSVHYALNHKRANYGQLRAGGSLGWAVGTLIMGRILLHHDTSIIFRTAFFMLILMGLVVLIAIRDDHSTVKNKFRLSDLSILLHNRELLWFYVLLFLYGIGVAPLNLFINVYFHELGASNQQLGYAFAFQAFAEAPMFFIAGWFIVKMGAPRIILITMVVTAIRLFIYSIASTPWQAIPVGMLQSFTLSLFWTSTVHFSQALVPQHLRGTGQSIIWALHFGAGVTIGNIIIGYVYEYHSMNMIMHLDMFWVLLVTICFAVYFRWIHRKNIRVE